MKPPPQVETEGLRAYEQARAFEGLQRRRLPLLYCAMTLLFVISGGAMLAWDRPYGAIMALVMAVVYPVLALFNWRRLRKRHEKNQHLLADLEARYGEQLPWLQVERHLAALQQLQDELAQEKRKKEA
jgi:ABC-type bacteriocin/lantibiotic exporter with double-glycine peptidase domain